MKGKISYQDAFEAAAEMMARLRPACERIEAAGSLRRREAWVGDVELVMIPKRVAITDMFGFEVGSKCAVEEALAGMGVLCDRKGERFKQVRIGGVTWDLFLVDAETWGVQFTLRTGCADFSHWLVTHRSQGGALPGCLRVKDGRIWKAGAAMDTREERDVFEAIGVKWVDPEGRDKGWWGRSDVFGGWGR